ncbi:unnamed protein product [Polarella glacialis]|uniref:SRR1-like domain-containing protein n=1 Tax=Polarella glacialis TaxID=89957 RepID=A0A813FWG9_POLGL|nr:unnamed protein product [Polarella glacialis]CAE8739304.1 unnamed protein product [Polarella glacialis]
MSEEGPDTTEWKVKSRKRPGRRPGNSGHAAHEVQALQVEYCDEPLDPAAAARTAARVRERAVSLRGSSFLTAACTAATEVFQAGALLSCSSSEGLRRGSGGKESLEGASCSGGSSGVRLLCLGIGSPEASASSVWQLALAWLLAEDLGISDRTWADPQMRRSDAAAGEQLGFRAVEPELLPDGSSASSDGRPLLLFMPHCDRALYEMVLAANCSAHAGGRCGSLEGATSCQLGDVVILGNSFQVYAQRDELGVVPSGTPGAARTDSLLRRLLPALREQLLPIFQPCPEAFNDLAVISFPAAELARWHESQFSGH